MLAYNIFGDKLSNQIIRESLLLTNIQPILNKQKRNKRQNLPPQPRKLLLNQPLNKSPTLDLQSQTVRNQQFIKLQSFIQLTNIFYANCRILLFC